MVKKILKNIFGRKPIGIEGKLKDSVDMDHTTISDIIRHYLNPLHVYCIETYVGIPNKVALVGARWYERNVYEPLKNTHLI